MCWLREEINDLSFVGTGGDRSMCERYIGDSTTVSAGVLKNKKWEQTEGNTGFYKISFITLQNCSDV